MFRRQFLQQSGLFAAGRLVGFPDTIREDPLRQPLSLIIDADTGNEIDDLNAIVRALVEPGFKIVGITAAQYHTSPQALTDSVTDSYRINQEILALMGRKNIPALRGSNHPMITPK